MASILEFCSRLLCNTLLPTLSWRQEPFLVIKRLQGHHIRNDTRTRNFRVEFLPNTIFAIFNTSMPLNINPLNPELNPICYLLALLDHHFLHVSRIRVKSLTIRLIMSYIHGAPILDVSRSHTTTQHSR